MIRYIIWGCVAGLIIGSASQLRAHAATENSRMDVCVELRNQVPLSDIEQELELTGFSAAAAGRYTGEQVKLYCPDMYVALTGLLS